MENPASTWTLSVGQNVDVEAGDRVVVNCKANGRPSPTVTWYRSRNGMRTALTEQVNLFRRQRAIEYLIRCLFYVTKVNDDGSLVWNSVETADAGTYTCFADNGFGTAENSSQLTVALTGKI